ncbi:hypothetical protein NESM_000484800 [Novymonas esmeraldas]|uniref:Uncharacterized protein n=1 Tax=Novymonas esmeraldas TaxID=1808958 RepID=A0AAW0EN59_9TRYP
MPPSAKSGSSASAERVVDVDPLAVYFTFSRIRPRFSCGRTIEETLRQLRAGELHPRDLPLLSVLTDGVHLYSQNNRRLYTYKQLKREGLLDTVPVRLRPLPQTKRMHSKYTPETCALVATLMRDTAVKDGRKDGSAAAGHSSDGDDDGDDGKSEEQGPDAVDEPAPSRSTPPHSTRGPRHGGDKGKETQHGPAASAPPAGPPPRRHAGAAAKRKSRRGKGAVVAQSPSTDSRSSSSNSGGGGATALEAELRRLGLGT